ncbi:MAG: biotin transporter BioY [Bacillota bacterium]|nr:biotin transporter BioY [Bacillota bacterium]
MMTSSTRWTLSPIRAVAAVALLAAVIGTLAFVAVPLPFSPVPLSGQSFGVMLAGALLGPYLGPLAVLVYLLLGLAGLPVFAGGHAGPGVLVGPTGGYLWGFAAGAWVIGLVSSVRKNQPAWQTLLGIALGGILVVYALGVAQLALVSGLPLGKALAVGVLPFLPGDLVKAVAAAAVVRRPAVRRVMLDYFAGRPTPPPED